MSVSAVKAQSEETNRIPLQVCISVGQDNFQTNVLCNSKVKLSLLVMPILKNWCEKQNINFKEYNWKISGLNNDRTCEQLAEEYSKSKGLSQLILQIGSRKIASSEGASSNDSTEFNKMEYGEQIMFNEDSFSSTSNTMSSPNRNTKSDHIMPRTPDGSHQRPADVFTLNLTPIPYSPNTKFDESLKDSSQFVFVFSGSNSSDGNSNAKQTFSPSSPSQQLHEVSSLGYQPIIPISPEGSAYSSPYLSSPLTSSPQTYSTPKRDEVDRKSSQAYFNSEWTKIPNASEVLNSPNVNSRPQPKPLTPQRLQDFNHAFAKAKSNLLTYINKNPGKSQLFNIQIINISYKGSRKEELEGFIREDSQSPMNAAIPPAANLEANVRSCWEVIAIIGIALGSGILLSALLVLAVPAYPFVAALIIGSTLTVTYTTMLLITQDHTPQVAI